MQQLLSVETKNVAILTNNTALRFNAAMATLGPERVASIEARLSPTLRGARGRVRRED